MFKFTIFLLKPLFFCKKSSDKNCVVKYMRECIAWWSISINNPNEELSGQVVSWQKEFSHTNQGVFSLKSELWDRMRVSAEEKRLYQLKQAIFVVSLLFSVRYVLRVKIILCSFSFFLCMCAMFHVIILKTV